MTKPNAPQDPLMPPGISTSTEELHGITFIYVYGPPGSGKSGYIRQRAQHYRDRNIKTAHVETTNGNPSVIMASLMVGKVAICLVEVVDPLSGSHSQTVGAWRHRLLGGIEEPVMTKPMPDDKIIEQAVGDLAAALFRMAKKDAQSAFDNAGAAMSVLSGMRRDLIKSGRVEI